MWAPTTERSSLQENSFWEGLSSDSTIYWNGVRICWFGAWSPSCCPGEMQEPVPRLPSHADRQDVGEMETKKWTSCNPTSSLRGFEILWFGVYHRLGWGVKCVRKYDLDMLTPHCGNVTGLSDIFTTFINTRTLWFYTLEYLMEQLYRHEMSL